MEKNLEVLKQYANLLREIKHSLTNQDARKQLDNLIKLLEQDLLKEPTLPSKKWRIKVKKLLEKIAEILLAALFIYLEHKCIESALPWINELEELLKKL